MPTERELLDRIRELEMMNSELQDKLDMIYSIVAPDDDVDDPGDGRLVQIDSPRKPN